MLRSPAYVCVALGIFLKWREPVSPKAWLLKIIYIISIVTLTLIGQSEYKHPKFPFITITYHLAEEGILKLRVPE